LAFRRSSKGCKRAAEAEVEAVRELEKLQREELIFCKVSLHFGGAAKAVREQQKRK
jgi:hypothetical protein